MRRHELGDDQDRLKICELLKGNNPGWKQTRLIALKMGMNPQTNLNSISDATGASVASIKRWFSAFRENGLAAALHRNYGIGRPSGLDEEIEAYLLDGLKNARWNTAKQTQAALVHRFDRDFKYTTVLVWIKKCAGVLRVPRPVHEKRNPSQAEVFKRSFLKRLRELPIPQNRAVKVWIADESRYGLLPNLRRVWTLKGKRPLKKWQSRFEWSYCYGALDVVEGKTVFLQTPTVSLDWTEAFLKQIKKQYPTYEHVIVWDGAGFHPKDDSHAQIPEGIHTIMLPPYSPELSPIEKLWDLIQDHTSNKLWPSIKRLDQVVALHLKDWWENPNQVISLIGKGWLRASVNASVI